MLCLGCCVEWLPHIIIKRTLWPNAEKSCAYHNPCVWLLHWCWLCLKRISPDQFGKAFKLFINLLVENTNTHWLIWNVNEKSRLLRKLNDLFWCHFTPLVTLSSSPRTSPQLLARPGGRYFRFLAL